MQCDHKVTQLFSLDAKRIPDHEPGSPGFAYLNSPVKSPSQSVADFHSRDFGGGAAFVAVSSCMFFGAFHVQHLRAE